MPQNNEKDTLTQRLSDEVSSAITDSIYEKVESLLGAGDQLFTMEFPGRPLNPDNHKADADDKYCRGNFESSQ